MLYTILTVGALTTLYPFILMISIGLKGPTDQSDNTIIPKYFGDDKELMAKYLDDKYSGEAGIIASTRIGPDQAEVKKYNDFLMTLPLDMWTAGFKLAPNQVSSKLMVRYQDWLRGKFATIDDLNRAYFEENVAFQTVPPPSELLERATWKSSNDQKYQDWLVFKATLPAEFRIPVRRTRLWQEFLRVKYKNRIDDVPQFVKTGKEKKFEDLGYLDKSVVRFSFTEDRNALIDEFEREIPDRYKRRTIETLWQEYLRIRYKNRINDVPAVAKLGGEKRFEDLTFKLPQRFTFGAILEHLRMEFFAQNPDRGKGGTAEDLWAKISSDPMPIAGSEQAFVNAHATELKQEFAGRNYRFVLDYILLHGRAVWNTIIFCGLAVLTQLIVNPIAAYALSRYPIKSSGKILLFLLATMAFPAEVAMIPSFLMLKDLGLLNTFAALILPGAASGYMIFLLKGFFDSLPPELFEAGQLDGAKETTLLAKVAIPLSRPVLGYLALMAFMGSYSTFMFAFLVIQDQKMWTLMVWVYQLQTSAPKAVVMAALALAALPTLVVFLFAQRVIMRGIVLPGER